jgi:hypothetical protein
MNLRKLDYLKPTGPENHVTFDLPETGIGTPGVERWR